MGFFDSAKKFVKDPKRVGAFLATGGLSEVARAGMKELAPDAPPAPELPQIDAAANAAAVSAAEAEQRFNARRGRASTILSGVGLTSGNTPGASLSRRTLIGF